MSIGCLPGEAGDSSVNDWERGTSYFVLLTSREEVPLQASRLGQGPAASGHPGSRRFHRILGEAGISTVICFSRIRQLPQSLAEARDRQRDTATCL